MEITVKRNNGAWLEMVLLKHVEGRDISALWAFAVHNSDKLDRVTKMNCEARADIANAFPGLDMQIKNQGREKIHGKQKALLIPRYRLMWSEDVTVSGPIFEAVRLCDEAQSLYDNHKYTEALKLLVQASEHCRLFFPVYPLAIKCLNPARTRNAFLKKKEEVQVLFSNSVKMEKWCKDVGRGFAFNIIPEKYHRAIREECITSIDIRLQKLDTLQRLLRGESGSMLAPVRNPANIVLDLIADGYGKGSFGSLKGELSGSAFKIMLEDVRTEIMADERYKNLASQYGANSTISVISDEHLVGVLTDTAIEDQAYRFPEPGGSDKWRSLTVKKWVNLFFSPVSDRHDLKELSLDRMKIDISDELSPDGVAKRINCRKSDYQGKNNSDE